MLKYLSLCTVLHVFISRKRLKENSLVFYSKRSFVLFKTLKPFQRIKMQKQPSQVSPINNYLCYNISRWNFRLHGGFTKFHALISHWWNLVNLGECSKFHTETLLISKLGRCETCEGFFRTFLFKIFIDTPCYIRKIFTFEEIIFLLERCIVKKKTYLCECLAGEMAGHIRKRFLLYPDIEIANFKRMDRDNSNAHSVYMYIMC